MKHHSAILALRLSFEPARSTTSIASLPLTKEAEVLSFLWCAPATSCTCIATHLSEPPRVITCRTATVLDADSVYLLPSVILHTIEFYPLGTLLYLCHTCSLLPGQAQAVPAPFLGLRIPSHLHSQACDNTPSNSSWTDLPQQTPIHLSPAKTLFFNAMTVTASKHGRYQ